ncbi:rRNA pseudouridine synthase [soil metagenome]
MPSRPVLCLVQNGSRGYNTHSAVMPLPSLFHMSETIRLTKRLAEQIGCSRGEADQYIEGGWVQVDGKVVEEPGYRVLPEQLVELLPQASLAPVAPVTILLNNPAGLATETELLAAIEGISPQTQWADDRSNLHFLKRHLAELRPTEPLDVHAGGLMVYSQDWRIVRKLVADRVRIEQEYIVEVSGEIVPDGLALLNHGLTFNGKPLAPTKVSWQNEKRLRFAMKAPHRGQIAHMCEKVGLTVLASKRIRLGRIPLAALPAGQWRYLMEYEQF